MAGRSCLIWNIKVGQFFFLFVCWSRRQRIMIDHLYFWRIDSQQTDIFSECIRKMKAHSFWCFCLNHSCCYCVTFNITEFFYVSTV